MSSYFAHPMYYNNINSYEVEVARFHFKANAGGILAIVKGSFI